MAGSQELQTNLSESLEAAGVVGAWSHDMRSDGVVSDVRVKRLFGIVCSEPSRQHRMSQYVEAVHPEDRIEFAERIAQSAYAGGPFFARYRVIATGEARWVHDYGRFVLDGEGRPMRGQGIIIDAPYVGSHPIVVAGQSMSEIDMETRISLVADYLISARRIVRTLDMPRLQEMTDALLWDVGRTLAKLLQNP